ncbi:hypothetical protein IG631_23370 [Alternaria alternata]|nr:hypothetical protein IG631_23370 [Alternaria alternata]
MMRLQNLGNTATAIASVSCEGFLTLRSLTSQKLKPGELRLHYILYRCKTSSTTRTTASIGSSTPKQSKRRRAKLRTLDGARSTTTEQYSSTHRSSAKPGTVRARNKTKPSNYDSKKLAAHQTSGGEQPHAKQQKIGLSVVVLLLYQVRLTLVRRRRLPHPKTAQASAKLRRQRDTSSTNKSSSTKQCKRKNFTTKATWDGSTTSSSRSSHIGEVARHANWLATRIDMISYQEQKLNTPPIAVSLDSGGINGATIGATEHALDGNLRRILDWAVRLQI